MGKLIVEYGHEGGGTTHVYPSWRVNEMSFSDQSPGDIGAYRYIERYSADRKIDAVAEARRIGRAEGKVVEVRRIFDS